MTLDQIVEETRDWTDDLVAELIDGILRARQCEPEPPAVAAWRTDIRRRIEDAKEGRVWAAQLNEAQVRTRATAGLAELPGRKLVPSKEPRMLKPFEIDLLRQDLQAVLALPLKLRTPRQR